MSRITLSELARRDKWICHICGNRVNSLNDATRDHVVPKALGGTAGYKSRNLRLAHRWCNKAKGHKLFRAEQHGTGYVIVDPKGEIVSDEFTSFIEAREVAESLNEDRVYLDTHYELGKEIVEDGISDMVVILRNVSNNPVSNDRGRS